MTWSVEGKTCIVTGASTGIGVETALGLAKLGAKVVMTARNRGKGERALEYVRQKSGSDRVELMMVDLASFASIRAFAEEFRKSHERLHVLVNNAGALNYRRLETADGIELTFGVNHLGYFLLTHLLLDLLKSSAPARIVNVASTAHTRASGIDLDELDRKGAYSPMHVYAVSKLANVMFTYELARRLEGTGVTANALHPGVIRSGFGLNNEGLVRFVFQLFHVLAWPFLKSNAQGATTSLYVATAPELENVSGEYFQESREKASTAASHDVEAQRRLWEISERMTGLVAASG